MTPKKDILDYLESKGIMTVGFCDAEAMVDYAFFVTNIHENKKTYFDVGFEKTMDDESFYNPKVHLPGAKSIITFLLPYNLKLIRASAKPELAIAKASIFKDYHLTMKEYIDDIVSYIEETYHKKAIGFSDTGPLNDKALLLKTGTVQLLRNSLLYHKDYGSRFYIGYIITDLEVEDVSTNISDIKSFHHPYCEKCGRCSQACPNKAIEEHGLLSSNKCISFLTQSKLWDELPEGLTLNGYVYGCDICQLVCPLNGKELNDYNYESVVNEAVVIKELENMTNREFKSVYNRSSAGWIGKKKFLRNAKWNDTHR